MGRLAIIFLAALFFIAPAPLPAQAAEGDTYTQEEIFNMATEFFGLFAFSGKVTAFAAPLMVALVTGLTGDQRLGIASIAAFIVAGLVLVLGVREKR